MYCAEQQLCKKWQPENVCKFVCLFCLWNLFSHIQLFQNGVFQETVATQGIQNLVSGSSLTPKFWWQQSLNTVFWTVASFWCVLFLSCAFCTADVNLQMVCSLCGWRGAGELLCILLTLQKLQLALENALWVLHSCSEASFISCFPVTPCYVYDLLRKKFQTGKSFPCSHVWHRVSLIEA